MPCDTTAHFNKNYQGTIIFVYINIKIERNEINRYILYSEFFILHNSKERLWLRQIIVYTFNLCKFSSDKSHLPHLQFM